MPYIAYGCHWCWTRCTTAWSRELQPAAAPYYFGELEEALIHGTRTSVDHGMIGSDVDIECKSKTAFFPTPLSFNPNLKHPWNRLLSLLCCPPHNTAEDKHRVAWLGFCLVKHRLISHDQMQLGLGDSINCVIPQAAEQTPHSSLLSLSNFAASWRQSVEKTFNSICMYAAAGYLADRPPTLAIFPSWPMSHLQQPFSVSTASVSSFTVLYSSLLTKPGKVVLG